MEPSFSPEADKPNKQALLRLVFLGLCTGYVLAIAFAPGLTERSPLVCVSKRLLGMHCPSCGMTRAFASIVRLDVGSALRFNPLIILAAPVAVAWIFDAIIELALGFRPLRGCPRWLAKTVTYSFLLGFVCLFALRLCSWIAPSYNPGLIGIPPAGFGPS